MHMHVFKLVHGWRLTVQLTVTRLDVSRVLWSIPRRSGALQKHRLVQWLTGTGTFLRVWAENRSALIDIQKTTFTSSATSRVLFTLKSIHVQLQWRWLKDRQSQRRCETFCWMNAGRTGRNHPDLHVDPPNHKPGQASHSLSNMIWIIDFMPPMIQKHSL